MTLDNTKGITSVAFAALKAIMPVALAVWVALSVLSYIGIGVQLSALPERDLIFGDDRADMPVTDAFPMTTALILAINVISSIVLAALAFAAHNVVLTGGARSGKGALHSHPGALRTFMIVTVIILALNYIGVLLITSVADRMGESGLFAIVAFVLLFATIPIFCMHATIFPAIVDGGDTSLAAARARGVAWRIFAQTFVASFALAALAMLIFLPLAGMSTPSAGSGMGTSPLLPLLNAAFSVVYTIVIATILTKAYLAAERGDARGAAT